MTPIVDVGLGYNYWVELMCVMYEILWKGASYGLEYMGRIWEPRRQQEQHKGSRCYSSPHAARLRLGHCPFHCLPLSNLSSVS